jgi:hypothetical protein
MDFPARPPERIESPAGLAAALGATPREVWMGARDLMAVFETEQDVRALAPSFDAIRALGVFGVIVTAPGRDVDFVSRFFRCKASRGPATACPLPSPLRSGPRRLYLRARQIQRGASSAARTEATARSPATP